MALVRWDSSRELSSLQSEMNRLFQTFFHLNRVSDFLSAVFNSVGNSRPSVVFACLNTSFPLMAHIPATCAFDGNAYLSAKCTTHYRHFSTSEYQIVSTT